MFDFSVVFGNVDCSVAVLSSSFVFSKSSVQVSASFISICRLPVGIFDLADCTLSVSWTVVVFNVCE